jgi:hypothetical protein
VLGYHGQRYPGRLRRLDEPVRGIQADIDRLLHDQVLGGLRGQDADVGVQPARHAHAHHLDVTAGQQRAEIGRGLAAVGGGEGRGRAADHVGHRHQPGVRDQGDGLGVNRRDDPGADNPETAGHPATSVHSASIARYCGSATSGRSISGCQCFSHSTEIQRR